MNTEINMARVEGKSYDEIQEDVVRITHYFTNLWYKNYPVLKEKGYDKEQIVYDVWNGIYNKKNETDLSNLEKHFIKASENKYTIEYIMNVVKRTVLLTLKCRARDISKKPNVDSLDREIPNGDNGITLGDLAKSNAESIESQVEYRMMLESMPNKVYREYYYETRFGDKCKLSTKQILHWILEGYSITDMTEKVFCKDASNIPYKRMSELKRNTIEIVKEHIGGYND